MSYILKSDSYGNGICFDGYYTGHTYIYQQEYYAVCSTNISEIKIYKSKKIAENACKALNRKVSNYIFEVTENED